MSTQKTPENDRRSRHHNQAAGAPPMTTEEFAGRPSQVLAACVKLERRAEHEAGSRAAKEPGRALRRSGRRIQGKPRQGAERSLRELAKHPGVP